MASKGSEQLEPMVGWDCEDWFDLICSSVRFWICEFPILLALWICQRSVMAVGSVLYAYGWERQLAELNFHLLFLVPFLSMNPLPLSCPPSPEVLFTIRWYLFRIMLGAGLIKIKSQDPKWRWPSLSAMDCFYETQPVPNTLSRYFHWMSRWWPKGE
jgi:hypothetical protein